jgi:hypothetical protein
VRRSIIATMITTPWLARYTATEGTGRAGALILADWPEERDDPYAAVLREGEETL